jgi:2-polyprenyl-6-methoxyphenol hydroxylase-like FAD-dependent oxidoreductase
MPSDMPTSTHMVWHGGVSRLKRWGLLDRLAAAGAPPVRDFNLDLGAFVLRGRAPAGDVEECYAPRRYALDAMLVEAAVEAGAELRRGSVTGLRMVDGRVAGVRYSDGDGAAAEAAAGIVVGADGINSTIATAVDAAYLDQRPQLAGNIFSYFGDLPLSGMEFYSRPGRMIYAWPTNDGLTLAGMCIRYDDYRRLAADPEGCFHAELDALVPEFAARAHSARRELPWHKAATRNFCRRPWGPGWALVGDAGMTMDAITAAGISNAFRDAEYLADAIDAGRGSQAALDAALMQFEQRRDAASMPLYEFTCAMAALDPPPQDVVDLLVALRACPDDRDAYFGVFAQTVPVGAFFAPDNIARIMREASARKAGDARS